MKLLNHTTLGALILVLSCEACPARLISSIDPQAKALLNAAYQRTTAGVRYDGSYRNIAYPMGDVPDNIGVCTDLIVRAYRAIGIDLQELVHEDMKANFSSYPDRWALKVPDSNIDHRRVPNLEVYFERAGALQDKSVSFSPGDLVTWRIGGNLPHIGLISDRRSTDGARYLVVHNMGAGPRIDDMLAFAPVKKHFRFLPGKNNSDEQSSTSR